ncbi:hypothetical protein [Chitinophaga sp. OAE865]|uniref:hypothetical protein n=1 Tax=Chitinophaga sp. OAE865 TaxID=2817898 RepID=UPI001AE30037
MKALKFIPALIFVLSASLAFAGDKTETPSKSEGQTQLNVYYVTGESGSNYLLSTSPNPECDMGSARPCEITSTSTLGATVPKAQVDGQTGGIHIESFQPEF